jgi:GNAT superfamily N-acetyltransferase
MKFVKLTRKNFKEYMRVMRLVFIAKNDRKLAEICYRDYLSGAYRRWLSRLEYFLVSKRGEPIGITGFYQFKDRKNEAWFGWFGVVPGERRKGWGTKILKRTMSMTKRMGARLFKTYVTEIDACKFYEKNVFERFKHKHPRREVIDGKAVWTYEPKTVFYRKSL